MDFGSPLRWEPSGTGEPASVWEPAGIVTRYPSPGAERRHRGLGAVTTGPISSQLPLAPRATCPDMGAIASKVRIERDGARGGQPPCSAMLKRQTRQRPSGKPSTNFRLARPYRKGFSRSVGDCPITPSPYIRWRRCLTGFMAGFDFAAATWHQRHRRVELLLGFLANVVAEWRAMAEVETRSLYSLGRSIRSVSRAGTGRCP